MPVNSGSRPEAPLGGHITQAGPLLEDPVGVAAPAVDALPPRAVPPPLAAPAPVAPDPPEAVLLPPAPLVPVVEAAPAPPPVVPVVGLVEDVVVPAVGVAVVVDEFCMVGKAATPPPAGNPLRSVALPTPPVPVVAVCAIADETRAIDRKRANPELHIMANT